MGMLSLLAGIAAAVYGAHFLVEGGSAIAKRFNIPTLVIGSTIVAFGTSMPEFTVNINSAINGNADLALNTVVLVNIAATALLVTYVALAKNPVLGRTMGVVMLTIYAGYIANALLS